MAKSSSGGALPSGWLMSGSKAAHYKALVDSDVVRAGASTVCLKNKQDDPEGFGTWMTMNRDCEFLGRRVRMSVWLKTDEVGGRVQPWLRVDGPDKGNILAFDNFCQRSISSDTDWTLYESVLAVPENSTGIAYGVLLAGTGKVWMDEFTLEAAPDGAKLTDCACFSRKAGEKKNSSKKSASENKCGESASTIKGWGLSGGNPEQYIASVDTSTFHSGTRSALLTNRVENAEDFGTLMQSCSPDAYLGKRVRMTAWLKASDVTSWAAPWFSVSGPAEKTVSFDNCCQRPLKGTTDWTSYELVLSVPQDSTNLSYGVLLAGDGKVWIDDLSFEEVANDVPLTDCICCSRTPRNLNFEEN
ncbi:hypothetical protein BH11CYA1_BH11CYA1_08560 [soil metagenome]